MATPILDYEAALPGGISNVENQPRCLLSADFSDCQKSAEEKRQRCDAGVSN
jgi:hypothetical protein